MQAFHLSKITDPELKVWNQEHANNIHIEAQATVTSLKEKVTLLNTKVDDSIKEEKSRMDVQFIDFIQHCQDQIDQQQLSDVVVNSHFS